EEPPAEIVRRLRRLVLRGLRLQPLVAVEGMQLALELLLVGELAAGREHAVLRAPMRGIGADRLHGAGRRRGGAATGTRDVARDLRDLGDLQPARQPFEIALLLGLEITGHGNSMGSCRQARARPGRDTTRGPLAPPLPSGERSPARKRGR